MSNISFENLTKAELIKNGHTMSKYDKLNHIHNMLIKNVK